MFYTNAEIATPHIDNHVYAFVCVLGDDSFSSGCCGEGDVIGRSGLRDAGVPMHRITACAGPFHDPRRTRLENSYPAVAAPAAPRNYYRPAFSSIDESKIETGIKLLAQTIVDL